MLYASAQVDKQRATRLSDAIDSAFQQLGIFEKDNHKPGNVEPKITLPSSMNAGQDLSHWAQLGKQQFGADQKKEDFNAMRTELERALAGEIKRNEVALHMEADGLVVSLREIGFFDSGSAAIKPGAEAALARIANILHEHACAVRIEGHTDNVPIHTSQFASNWELSTARATALVRTLVGAAWHLRRSPIRSRLCRVSSLCQQRHREGTSAQPPRRRRDPDLRQAAGFDSFHPCRSLIFGQVESKG